MNTTTRKPMTPQFKQLVTKIRMIDPKAANWLVRNRHVAKYDMSLGASALSSLLYWNNTPQGFAFWEDIFDKLKKLDSLPESLKPQA